MYRGPSIGSIYTHPSRVGRIEELFPSNKNINCAIKMYSAMSFSSFTLDMFSYLLFNFNDYPSGMVTLFNLLVMGNWQIWMEVRISQAPLSCSLLRFLPHSFGGSDTYPVVYIYPFSSFPRYSCLFFYFVFFTL